MDPQIVRTLYGIEKPYGRRQECAEEEIQFGKVNDPLGVLCAYSYLTRGGAEGTAGEAAEYGRGKTNLCSQE